ncbi:MAG: AAA family ATPase [Vicinamibacteria bacterium]
MTQDEALAILKTGANVFLTGEPGSGKTHTVNRYVAYLRECGIEPAITASTGIAATHIQGMTIHSWSGIGVREALSVEDLNQIADNRWVAERVNRARVLIIDEVSMLSARTLSMVDAVCRKVRHSPAPFGGLQVVLVGDFFQLPPVVQKRREVGDLRLLADEEEDGSGGFSYQSKAWKALDPVVCYVTEQHRQDDRDFLRILSTIRQNACSPEDRERVRSRIGASRDAVGKAARLFPYNADVDRINAEELARLPGESCVFRMADQGPAPMVKMLKDGCLSPEELALKRGARVMFTRNNPAEGFVNGTLGTVVEFKKDSGYPVVRTHDDRTITAEPVEWSIEEAGRRVAKITQVPLRLAWAITVHKSQGLSLDAAIMDLSGTFEYGQGYVALSRVRTLAGLHVLGINDRAFEVHPEVLAKDREFRASSARARESFAAMGREELAALEADFIAAAGGKTPAIRGKQERRARPDDESTPSQPKDKQERRWQKTLAMIKRGKTIEEVARERGRGEGTILEHLEELHALGKLRRADIAHLVRGKESTMEAIWRVFRASGVERGNHDLSRWRPDDLRLARLLFEAGIPEAAPKPEEGRKEVIGQKTYSVEEIRATYKNAYAPWTEEDDTRLEQEARSGRSIGDLARRFGRNEGAIRSRLRKLGLE